MEDQLAINIRQARHEAGLSREQVAAALGCSLSTVVRYETGRTKRIGVETLVRIGNATGKPLHFFIEGIAA
jgi:transcriptional regulator with XRE-family HTH domain